MNIQSEIKSLPNSIHTNNTNGNCVFDTLAPRHSARYSCTKSIWLMLFHTHTFRDTVAREPLLYISIVCSQHVSLLNSQPQSIEIAMSFLLGLCKDLISCLLFYARRCANVCMYECVIHTGTERQQSERPRERESERASTFRVRIAHALCQRQKCGWNVNAVCFINCVSLIVQSAGDPISIRFLCVSSFSFPFSFVFFGQRT